MALCLSSCHFLDVEPKIICSETFYTSAKEAQYGLAGVYGAMNHEHFYGNYYSLMMANIDDLCYFNRPTTSNYTNYYSHDASASEIYAAWVRIYAGIRNANEFMEAISESEYDPDDIMFSEARFLRAYYHFILAQGWGDVPLRTSAVKTNDECNCKATKQTDILNWVISEMEECIKTIPASFREGPSRLTKTSMQGIYARVNLFMAGKSVDTADKAPYWKNALDATEEVITSEAHHLNPSYSKVFINMIANSYDREYNESMWEVEFNGDRSTPDKWSNGRIGDVIGLQSSASSGYSDFKCNYSYGMYNGSLKLWDLYWTIDRTDEENTLPNITDSRQAWNMPPYNYAGSDKYAPYGGDGSRTTSRASIDKTPYAYNSIPTTTDPLSCAGSRNCGKWRREVEYEGVSDAKRLYTTINFPLLRYSDVLLMNVEASLEYYGEVRSEAYDRLKLVRNRAGIATRTKDEYDVESFRTLVHNERGRELCFEALRKFDLIRWGEFVDTMHEYSMWVTDDRWVKDEARTQYASTMAASVQAKHILFPIPTIELGVNKLLKQNQLW